MVRAEEDNAVGNALSAPPETSELALQILVVDDNPDLLQILCEMLESAGHAVAAACNGFAALQLAQDSSIPLDLVITDVNMPGMNGIEFSRRVQALRPEIKVMFVSACAGNFLASEVGPDAHFLPKPFTRTALLAKILTTFGC